MLISRKRKLESAVIECPLPWEIVDKIFCSYFLTTKSKDELPDVLKQRYELLQKMCIDPSLIYRSASNLSEAIRFFGAFKFDEKTSYDPISNLPNLQGGKVVRPSDVIAWLRKKDNVDLCRDAYETAATFNLIEIMKELIPSGLLHLGYNDNIAIRSACEAGQTEIVKLLLQNEKVDPRAKGNIALRLACEDGHYEIVKLLLNHPKSNPADFENDAIMRAVKYENVSIVKLLIQDTRVNPSACRNAPIRYACASGNMEIIELLLVDRRVDPSDYDNEAIQKACRYGYVNVVELLLKDERVYEATLKSKDTLAQLEGHKMKHLLYNRDL